MWNTRRTWSSPISGWRLIDSIRRDNFSIKSLETKWIGCRCVPQNYLHHQKKHQQQPHLRLHHMCSELKDVWAVGFWWMTVINWLCRGKWSRSSSENDLRTQINSNEFAMRRIVAPTSVPDSNNNYRESLWLRTSEEEEEVEEVDHTHASETIYFFLLDTRPQPVGLADKNFPVVIWNARQLWLACH